MVGVRVLMGGRSLERSPSTIEVFNRTKQVSISKLTFLRKGELLLAGIYMYMFMYIYYTDLIFVR